MDTRRAWRRGGVAVIAAAMVLAGCSTKATGGGDGGDGGAGGDVNTGTGVTAESIKLGVLTDLTGVFAALGTSITNAQKLFWKDVTICGRSIELVIKDHGYDVQQAVTSYNQMVTQVLGFPNVLGSPINAALLDRYKSDNIVAIPVSWSSFLLSNPGVMLVGTSYDYEMVNAVDYALKEGLIAEGDTIGHIYFEGEYGKDGLLGTRFAAEQNNLELVEQQVKATITDLTAQMTTLKNRGAKAVFLTIGPTATASAASAARALGWDVPLIGQNPSFAPGIMDTAAGPILEEQYIGVASWLQPPADNQAVSSFISEYENAYPNAQIDGGITWGYAAGLAYKAVLDKACQNGDLTRDGVREAFRSLQSVDTKGIVAELDYTKLGEAPAKEVYVFKPDPSVPGALSLVSDGLFKGKDVEAYTPPALR